MSADGVVGFSSGIFLAVFVYTFTFTTAAPPQEFRKFEMPYNGHV